MRLILNFYFRKNSFLLVLIKLQLTSKILKLTLDKEAYSFSIFCISSKYLVHFFMRVVISLFSNFSFTSRKALKLAISETISFLKLTYFELSSLISLMLLIKISFSVFSRWNKSVNASSISFLTDWTVSKFWATNGFRTSIFCLYPLSTSSAFKQFCVTSPFHVSKCLLMH